MIVLKGLPSRFMLIVKPGPTVPVSLGSAAFDAFDGATTTSVPASAASNVSVRMRVMQLLPSDVLPCQDRGGMRVQRDRNRTLALDRATPRLDAGRRRAGRLGAGGRLLLLRRARIDRALRPAGADGGSRPVPRGARSRRRAGSRFGPDPVDRGGSSTLGGRSWWNGTPRPSTRCRPRWSWSLDRWDERASTGFPSIRRSLLGDVVISRGPELEIPRSWVGEEHYDWR